MLPPVWLSRSLVSAFIAGGAAGVPSHSARAGTAPVVGTYVSLEGGVDFQQYETMGAIPAISVPKRVVRFDPGFAGDASIGYGLGNGLRVELEGDYLNDHIRKVYTRRGDIRRAGGYQQQYGGFANVLYDIPVALPVTPYVGIGAGGQILQADNLNSSQPGFQFPRRGGSATISSFAYQAIAGLSMPVPYVRGLALTAEYRFMGLVDPLQEIPFRSFTRDGQLFGEGNERLGNVLHHSILFGVRYNFYSAPPSPAPRPPPVMAPAPAPARTYLVFFDWDRSDLSGRAREIINEAAQASTRVQVTRIEVNGYTDNSAIHAGRRGEAYNQALSVRRARSVQAELVNEGVPAAAIEIHGYGEANPSVSAGPDTREAQNRRVEIILR